MRSAAKIGPWQRISPNQVVALATEQYPDGTVDVESIQDLVEKVLIENGHAKTAKAYILYREKRRSAREANALIGATIEMFSNYMGDNDWRVKENANAQKSINGMNNYIRETFTKQYWLHEIYPEKIRKAHQSGDLHLHDLGFFRSLLRRLGSAPASHRRVRRRCPARWNPVRPSICAAFRADRQFHVYHPGRDGGRSGMEQL